MFGLPLEGLLTIACGLVMLLLFPSDPETTRIFTDRERELAIARIYADQPSVSTFSVSLSRVKGIYNIVIDYGHQGEDYTQTRQTRCIESYSACLRLVGRRLSMKRRVDPFIDEVVQALHRACLCCISTGRYDLP